MLPLAVMLSALLAGQAGTGQPAPRVDATATAPPMPELIVAWVYPRASSPRVIEQNIVPREQDVVRMRTNDPAELVEAFYRNRVIAEGGSYSVVSAVNQRIVANRFTVVTIEPVRGGTVITVVANQPELEPSLDPAVPFPVKKGVRPPPS